MATAKHDLTSVMSKHLDRHLVFPLVEFLQSQGVYNESEVLAGKLELLRATNMVDFAIEIAEQVSKGDVAALKAKREQVIALQKELKAKCGPLLGLFEDGTVKALREERTLTAAVVGEQFGVTEDNVAALFRYAKLQFDCGHYSSAADLLSAFRSLSVDGERAFQTLWGSLAAEILAQHWDAALDVLNKLREAIDSHPTMSHLEQLQQRTWLIHWSLFVFFNHKTGRTGIIDMLFQERYLNAIQTNCPHILRYLATAVVTNKRRRGVLKDLVKVIQSERYTYSDPITEFVECLYVNFDFETAQSKLAQCEELLVNDFFLVALKDDFLENARLFIFETYCRIHKCIDISMLAEKLSMNQEQAERWVVNLIRNATLDAKIDSQANRVVMSNTSPDVYQQVIEKTKGLAVRSQMLSSNMEKWLQGKATSANKKQQQKK